MGWQIVAVVIAAALSAYSYAQSRRMQAQAKRQADEMKAQQLSGHDSNRALYTVYGTTLIGSTVVWKGLTKQQVPMSRSGFVNFGGGATSTKNKNWKQYRMLHRAVALCNGPINSVQNILVDGESYNSSRFSRNVSWHFGSVVSYGPESGQYYSGISAHGIGQWDSSKLGKGVAYAIERLWLDKDKPAYQGEPNTQYVVQGRSLYDPRLDDTAGGVGTHRQNDPNTWVYSENPALALLDYLTNDEYGRGLDYADIDIPSFISAADKCDVLVPIPERLINNSGQVFCTYDPRSGEEICVPNGQYYNWYRPGQTINSQRRFTLNLAIDNNKEVLDNVQEILNNFRANLYHLNGKYSVRMEDVAEPVLSLGDDDIIGGLKISEGERKQRMNRMTVKFLNENKNYKTDQVSWPAVGSAEYAEYLLEDEGEKLHKTLTLKGCDDYYQAEDIAEYMVRESRASLTVSGTFGSRCFGLVPGDVIDLTYNQAGYVGKYFIVDALGIDPASLNVKLQLREYDSSVYTWNPDKGNEPLGLFFDEEFSYNDVPAILSIGEVTATQTTASDGSAVMRISVALIDVPETAERVEVEWRVQGEDDYSKVTVEVTQTKAVFYINIDDVTLELRARFFVRNQDGFVFPSNYATATVVVPPLLDTKLGLIQDGATANVIYQQDDPPVDSVENPLNPGDIWLDTNNDNRFHRWDDVNSQWVDVSDSRINTALQDAANAQLTADGAIVAYYQDDEPTGAAQGDIWFDTNDGNKVYYYNGTAWVVAQDTGIADAISNAATAQATADGKITTFFVESTTPPTAESVGDLWYQTDTGIMLRWNGTAWDNVARTVNTYLQATQPIGTLFVGDIWYDTDDGNRVYVYSGTAWVDRADTRIAQALSDAANAQSTADGAVVSYYQDNPPTGSVNVGDLWIDTNAGNRLYIWQGDGGDPEVFSWVDAQDSAIGQALQDAADAQAAADGKVTTFFTGSASPPTAEGIGDLWYQTDTGIMQRWNGSTWQNVANFNTTYRQDNAPTGTLFVGDTWFDTNDGNRQYVWDGAQWRDVADTRIAQALLDASNAQSTADGAIQSYYQDDQPTEGSEGDFWIDTNDGNKLYVYNSGAWVASQDSDIQQAINDAAGAQATADGKVTTFFDVVANVPTAEGEGDLWYQTDTGILQRWDGTAWRTINKFTNTYRQDTAPTGLTLYVNDLWFDTDDSNRLYYWNGTTWVDTSDERIAQALLDASNAQATADGAIVAFYQDEEPLTAAEGDFWIDTNDGNRLYIYNTGAWVDAQDDAIGQALAAAANAQGTADGKITTFFALSTATPTTPSTGDLWYQTDTGILLRWSGSAWQQVSNTARTFRQSTEPTGTLFAGDTWYDTDDNNRVYVYDGTAFQDVADARIQTALDNAANAQSTADGAIVAYYQDNEPATGATGDFWIDTNDGNKLYIYDSGAWVVAQDTAIGDALQAAADAQGTADGKVTTFFAASGTPPTPEGEGDLWYQTDVGVFLRWNGVSWQEVANYARTFRQPSEPTGTLYAGDTWYDTDDNNRVYVYNGTAWLDTSDLRLQAALDAAANAQSTADGAIQAYYQDDQPTGGAEGDFWIDTNDGNKLYIYDTGAWVVAQDTAIGDALAAAQGAQGTADGKITTFFAVSTSPPTAEGEGDLWYQTDTGTLNRWSGSAWQQVSNIARVFRQPTAPAQVADDLHIGDTWYDTDDNNKVYVWTGSAWEFSGDLRIAQALLDASNAQATADGAIQAYYQDEPPTGAAQGDFWIDTNDGNKLYIYDSGAWVDAQDNAIGTALQDAADAQSTADGKVTTFFAASGAPPTPEGDGDMWYQNDTSLLFRWNASLAQWQEVASYNTGLLADLDSVGDGEIDDDSITMVKINTALESDNYSAGVSGWRIARDGDVQFNNGLFTGDVIGNVISVGSGAQKAVMQSVGTVRFYAGTDAAQQTTPFYVTESGRVVARNISLVDENGSEYFNAAEGFTAAALTQFAESTTGVTVTTYSTSGTDATETAITLSQTSNVDFEIKFNADFQGNSFQPTEAGAELVAYEEIPDNFTVEIHLSTSQGFTPTGTTEGSGTLILKRQFFRTQSVSPSAVQYQALVDALPDGDQFLGVAFINPNVGCVNAQNFVIQVANESALAAGTHYIKTKTYTSDSQYNTQTNKVGTTASRTLSITDNTVGGGFSVSGSGGSQSVGQGDITAVTLNPGGGITVNGQTSSQQVLSGSATFTLDLDQSQIDYGNIANTPSAYVLPTATATVKGGVELFSNTTQTTAANSVTSTANRTYGIQLNAAGQAVVNVPWQNTQTVYTHPSYTEINLDTNGATVIDTMTVDDIGSVSGITTRTMTLADLGYTGATNANNYSLPAATATVRGGIELASNTVQSVAANTVSATAGRTYGVQVNSAGQAVVNVPWTDQSSGSNTTYDLNVPDSTTQIRLTGSDATTDNVTISGAGATTVSRISATELQISSVNTVYSLPLATATTRGGVELFSNTDQSVAANAVSSTAGRTYGIQLNSANQMVVNVPWTDNNTVYTHPSYTERSINTSGATVIDTFTSDAIGSVTGITTRTMTLADLGYTGATNANNYSLPLATATTRGGVELFSNTDQSVAANAVSSTAGRTYGIQLNSANQMVVNVPWTDNNSVYTHPAYTARSINTNGATVIDTFTSDAIGSVTGITTRTMTLADLGYTGATDANNYSLPLATATTRGGVELFSNTDQSVAANAVSSTAGRTYGIQLNSANQMVVNVPWTDNNTVYTHPSFNGDDFSIDTGPLTGATVISDLDINITTNSQGHVTDANGTVSTRNLTLANLGYTGATNANYITNNNQLTNGAGYYKSGDNVLFGAINAATVTATGDITAFSDARLKSDIETLPSDVVYKMRGVTYVKDDRQGSGVIAQELLAAGADELVHDNGVALSVNYAGLTGYLIETVKSLKSEMDELREELEELKRG